MNDYQKAQKWLETYDWDNDPEADDNLAMICEALQDIQKYRDAEEQGWLVRLPCKVGDTVYIIGGKYRAGKYEKWINEGKFNISDFEKLGKTVFLTPEEAAEALQKMKEQSE